MVIQHNLPAMNSHRNLGLNNSFTAKNLEKLSSGYKINRAGDDAAGLAISEKMRGQIRGLAMAEQNVSNGISLIQTAEGGLNETHAILQRMRELAVQSANGTYDESVDRVQLEKEFQAIKSEIDRISESTHYNGIKLLDGSMGGKVKEGVATLTADTGFGAISALTAPTAGMVKDQVYASSYGVSAVKQEDGKFTITATFTNDLGETSSKTFKDLDLSAATVTAQTATAGISLTTTAIEFIDSKGGKVSVGLGISGAQKEGALVNGSFGYTATSATASTAMTANTNAYTYVGKGLTFQIGANGTADQRVSLGVSSMDSKSIGFKDGKWLADASIATQDDANFAIDVITRATNQVSGTRADLGALQNRLEHTMNNLGVTKENLTAAESVIRDVDMAKEMMEFTKNQILVQASQAMLAQANQLPQGVLNLLR